MPNKSKVKSSRILAPISPNLMNAKITKIEPRVSKWHKTRPKRQIENYIIIDSDEDEVVDLSIDEIASNFDKMIISPMKGKVGVSEKEKFGETVGISQNAMMVSPMKRKAMNDAKVLDDAMIISPVKGQGAKKELFQTPRRRKKAFISTRETIDLTDNKVETNVIQKRKSLVLVDSPQMSPSALYGLRRGGRVIRQVKKARKRSLFGDDFQVETINVDETAEDWKVDMDKMQGLKSQLFEHQKSALNWILNREDIEYEKVYGGLMCDEMGLGKTLTFLSVISHDLANQKNPTLIICSKTLLNVWESEIKTHFEHNSLTYFIFQSKNSSKLKARDLSKYDIVLTTYPTVRGCCQFVTQYIEDRLNKQLKNCKDEDVLLRQIQKLHQQPLVNFKSSVDAVGKELLMGVDWHRVICDEAHEFRNPSSKLARAIWSVQAKRRWYVSGTPIQNNADDIYSAFKYLRYGNESLMGNRRRWNKAIKDMNPYIKKTIKKLMLCRSKDDVKKETRNRLPPVETAYLKEKMSDQEKTIYDFWKNDTQSKFSTQKLVQVLAGITRMRQCCCTPNLVRNSLPDDFKEDLTYNWDPKQGTKINMVIDYLQQIDAEDKVLIFSEWTSLLDTVAHVIGGEGYDYVYLDGRQTVEERRENMNRFSQNDNVKVMLLSLRVGSEGLTLTEANHVIFLEPWWNPFVEEQAVARAHRTGQKKPVSVVYFIIEGTIEERVMEVAEKKRHMASNILSHGNRLDKESIRYLLFDE